LSAEALAEADSTLDFRPFRFSELDQCRIIVEGIVKTFSIAEPARPVGRLQGPRP
jgi:hypothetical protein